MILSLSTDAAARIVAIHEAASDADRSSAILSGVCLRSAAIATDASNGHEMVIVATDGKLLVEERWSLDAGSLDDGEINLGSLAVDAMKAWLKSIHKALGKRKSATLELSWDGKVATLSVPGLTHGPCVMRATEGSFPRYDHALRGTDKPTPTERIGYNLQYFAQVAKAWKTPGHDAVVVEATHYRGTVLRRMRLPIGCTSALALVMPVSLPT